MTNRQEQIIYLAGLIDGEGCVGLNRIRGDSKQNESPQYRPRIKVKMVDRPGLDLLKSLFGGSIRLHPPWHDQWEWGLMGWGPVSDALQELLPWLLIKNRQARLLIRLAAEVRRQPRRRPLPPEYLSKREQYYRWMGRLNRRAA